MKMRVMKAELEAAFSMVDKGILPRPDSRTQSPEVKMQPAYIFGNPESYQSHTFQQL